MWGNHRTKAVPRPSAGARRHSAQLVLISLFALPVLIGCASRQVARAPSPPAAAAERDTTGAYRFDMTQHGRRMTADEFDAWMKARGIRVAKGAPAKAAATAPSARVAGATRKPTTKPATKPARQPVPQPAPAVATAKASRTTTAPKAAPKPKAGQAVTVRDEAPKAGTRRGDG